MAQLPSRHARMVPARKWCGNVRLQSFDVFLFPAFTEDCFVSACRARHACFSFFNFYLRCGLQLSSYLGVLATLRCQSFSTGFVLDPVSSSSSSTLRRELRNLGRRFRTRRHRWNRTHVGGVEKLLLKQKCNEEKREFEKLTYKF